MITKVTLATLVTFLLIQVAGASDLRSNSTDLEQQVQLARSKTLLIKAQQSLKKDPATSLAHARHALSIVEEGTDAEAKLAALRAVGDAELHLGLHAEYMNTTLLALDAATQLSVSEGIAAALKDLSTAYQLNHRPDKAVAEAKRSLAVLLPLNDRSAIAEAYHFLTTALLKAGMHAEALNTSSQALGICKELQDAVCQARVHQATAEILIDMEKYADALPFLTKAERILMDSGNTSDRFRLALDRTRAMIGVGQTQHAKTSLEEAHSLFPKVNNIANRLALQQMNYELALALRQWEPALRYLQQIKVQSDSLERAQADMKTAALQVIHELKSKEQDNEQLRDLNAQQAETIADQRTSNRYLLALLIGVVVLAVALFITSRYAVHTLRRLKKKNEVIKKQHNEIQAKVLELKRQNLRLAESLMSEEEKELILKEIHHRVKNNLQVVDSLLNIQGNDVQDPKLQELLKEAQGRIRSMAMVHEHIYRASSDPHASLRAHFDKLGRSVLVAHGVHDRISIAVTSDLPTFPVDTLLPLSLMVNELFTNSLKHAFAGREAGNIRLRIAAADEGYELRYTDDGVGLMNLQGGSESSFGHELISILAHQLNGEVEVMNGPGAVFKMTFTPDRDVLRVAV